jgi:hypothetical protein
MIIFDEFMPKKSPLTYFSKIFVEGLSNGHIFIVLMLEKR